MLLDTRSEIMKVFCGFQEPYIDPYHVVREIVIEVKDNITNYC